MLGEKKNVSGPGTIVGANVKLVGTLQDANEITIHGKIEGEVISEKTINIAETAYIKGPVSAEIIQVAGQVRGSITATNKLEIMPTGKVFGSITAKDLSIRSGAIFVGKSNMVTSEKEPAPEEEEKTEKEETNLKKEKEPSYEIE